MSFVGWAFVLDSFELFSTKLPKFCFVTGKLTPDAFLFRKLPMVLRISLNILSELSLVPYLPFWPHTYLPYPVSIIRTVFLVFQFSDCLQVLVWKPLHK